MLTLLGLACAGILYWYFSKGHFARDFPAIPRLVPRLWQTGLRPLAGGGALAVAVLLGLRGRLDMALGIGSIGAWLLGQDTILGLLRQWGVVPARLSRHQTESLMIEINQDSGDVSGTILKGQQQGKTLDELDKAALVDFARTCAGTDPNALGLLEVYFDRRFPGWREDLKADLDARRSGGIRAGVMTPQEAYEILGLKAGATGEEIRAAHRTLIKKLHPDQGGSTYLAARVNEARDLLLSRHP
jgi:hypothetical protein